MYNMNEGNCERCKKRIIPNNWLSISCPPFGLIYFCTLTCMKEYCGIAVEYDPIFNNNRSSNSKRK